MSVLGWLILLVVWTALSWAGLIVSVMLSNPLAIGPAGVTMWFLILFLASAALVTLALYGAKTYLHLHGTGVARLRYSWRQGLLVGGWLTGLLALSSLRQLGLWDAILLGLLLVIVEIYVRFRWP